MTSKLLSLFEALTPSERRDLAGSTRWLNRGQHQVKLYGYLNQRKISGQLATYDRQSAFFEVFKTDVYDDQRMRLLESALLDSLECYLVERELSRDKELYERLRMKVYHDRGLVKSYRYASSMHERLTDSTITGDKWYHRYAAARNRLSFDSRHQSRKQELPFASVVDSLDAFYIAAKLRHACEIINARNVLGVEVDLRMMEEVRGMADVAPFDKDIAIIAYKLVYDSLMHPEEEGFVAVFTTFLKENVHRFPNAEQLELFQYLKNYCIKKLNTGRTEYTRLLFDIYGMNLANKELFSEEPLSPFEFKNIVTIALRLGESEWVNDFINGYLDLLPADDRHNAEIYNRANYHYFKKDYKTTFRLLQQVEFTDVFYALDARSILLKSCFEQREEELFAYQASSFRTFLSRNRKVSEYQRTIYRNFIRFAALLLKADGEPQAVKRIAEEMESVRQIADIRWLRERVESAGK